MLLRMLFKSRPETFATSGYHLEFVNVMNRLDLGHTGDTVRDSVEYNMLIFQSFLLVSPLGNNFRLVSLASPGRVAGAVLEDVIIFLLRAGGSLRFQLNLLRLVAVLVDPAHLLPQELLLDIKFSLLLGQPFSLLQYQIFLYLGVHPIVEFLFYRQNLSLDLLIGFVLQAGGGGHCSGRSEQLLTGLLVVIMKYLPCELHINLNIITWTRQVTAKSHNGNTFCKLSKLKLATMETKFKLNTFNTE